MVKKKKREKKIKYQNVSIWPWLVWLSGLSASLGTEKSPVQFPFRAHAWVAGQVPGWGHKRGNQWLFLTHQCFSSSLPPLLPLFLKINK